MDELKEINFVGVKNFLYTYGTFRLYRIRASRYIDENSEFERTEALDYLKKHIEIADILKKMDSFQEWIKDKAAFKDSLNIIRSSRIFIFDHGDEQRVLKNSPYSIDEEILWRLQYIFACGIYAFKYPEKMNENLTELGMCSIKKQSEKTLSTAKKLQRYLREDGVFVPDEFNNMLDHFIENKSFNPNYWNNIVSVNNTQRRKFVIFQIAGVGREEFLSQNAQKGRFYPKIVANILSLLGEDADIRTIEYIMQPFDKEEFLKLDEHHRYIHEKGLFTYEDWASDFSYTRID